MALSNYKSFVAGEVLLAADLNGLQSHFTGNALTLISPLTGSLDTNGNSIVLDADADSSIRETSDDVIALRLQGFDAFIYDGDVASPVNGLTFTSVATGGHPSITANGETNVNVAVIGKGTGGLRVTAGTQGILLDADPAGTGVDIDGAILVIDADGDSTLRESADDVVRLRLQGMDAVIFDGDVASPVNGFTITTSATTVAPQLRAQGTDSNISINLVPSGTGTVQCNGKTLYGELVATSASVGGTEIDFSGSLTTTYDEYWIKVEVVVGSDNQTMTMRTDANSGASYDATAGDYRYAARCLDDAGTATTIVSGAAATSVQLSEADLESTRTSFYTVHFLYCGDGSSGQATFEWTAAYQTSGGIHQNVNGSGHRASTTRIDSVRFRETGGANITGIAYLYGVRKA